MKKWVFTFLLLITSIALFLIGAIVVSNQIVNSAAEERTYDSISTVPSVKTGLLLGTSKKIKGGRPNLYFLYRIEAATKLLKSGKIQILIISGDNGSTYYNEPIDMKKALILNGIDSTKLYLDCAGFRTFDSMVRVKEIFGQKEVLVISQKFHNERAIYIAKQIGLNAIGFNAKDVTMYYGIKTSFREKLARVKVILDFLVGAEPRFLGEKVDIK